MKTQIKSDYKQNSSVIKDNTEPQTPQATKTHESLFEQT